MRARRRGEPAQGGKTADVIGPRDLAAGKKRWRSMAAKLREIDVSLIREGKQAKGLRSGEFKAHPCDVTTERRGTRVCVYARFYNPFSTCIALCIVKVRSVARAAIKHRARLAALEMEARYYMK